ncbi:MAG: restriction endonuclease [Terracidiphilus sp.]|jgi:restriction system protein
MQDKMPKFDQLMNPLLRALKALGGSGSIVEINDKVVELEKFPDEVLAIRHDPEKSTQTEIEYRLAWARSWLKKDGFLENSSRGVWALATKAKGLESVDPREVLKSVRAMIKSEREETGNTGAATEEDATQAEGWKQKLYSLLTQKLSPAAFERLVQRLLRESGFVQVEVTKLTGDGGIDGRGIARIHGLLSFHVLFQCKRYQGAVGPGEIRDFRGAMVGRSDKGLFITTGTFTAAATKEAARDGAPPIDLIDGDALAEKLRELGLGIRTERIEVSRVDDSWFESI